MATTAGSSDCSTLPMKRMREEQEMITISAPNFQDDGSSSSMNKKQKYLYEDILLSILDETVLEPQKQDHFTCPQPHPPPSSSILEISSSSSPVVSSNPIPVDQEEPERVIRHLLEASDDELGIPSTTSTHSESEEQDHGTHREMMTASIFQDDNIQIQCGSSSSWWWETEEDEASSSSWWWEIEDEAANYYTLFQSHLLSSIM